MAVELPGGLVTPALVVDVDVMDRNIERMAGAARTGGFALRPHAKTHKCPQIADRQLRSGASGLTVATLGEAEVFADAGADDLFVAYTLWPCADKARRMRRLAERVALRTAVESVAGARRLGEAVRGSARPVQVLVEVDSGTERTGVRPQAAGEVADEPVWQFPLHRRYRAQLNSSIADLTNMGGPNAGQITAGLFLEEFVDDVPWAHVDIAGTAWDVGREYVGNDASGYGVRLLVDLARHLSA